MRHLTTTIRDAMLPLAGRMRRKDWAPTDDTVLIFQPDHLGDILLSQPAVTTLRNMYSTSRLVAVVGPWSREIVSLSWPVDEIVTLSFPGFTRANGGSPVDPYVRLRAEAARLTEFRAQSAYVLRPDAWWAAWLASLVAPVVVTANDPRASHFATITAATQDVDHSTVKAYRIATAEAPVSPPTWSSSPLSLPNNHDAHVDASRLLKLSGVNGRFAVVHPGSGAAVKEWPTHRWIEVVTELGRDVFHSVVTGSDSESDVCAEIAASSATCTSIAGQTSVAVLAEVMRQAQVVVGPDCGPLHLAVATNAPTVHLFGPSDPQRYGPWGNPAQHQIVSAGWNCPRCGDLSPDRPAGCGCMLAIRPDEVVRAARSMLLQHAG